MTFIWSWLIGSKLGRVVGLIIAGAVAVLTLRWKWKREGALKERQEATNRDRTNAQKIRDRVRAASTADSLHTPEDDRIFRD